MLASFLRGAPYRGHFYPATTVGNVCLTAVGKVGYYNRGLYFPLLNINIQGART